MELARQGRWSLLTVLFEFKVLPLINEVILTSKFTTRDQTFLTHELWQYMILKFDTFKVSAENSYSSFKDWAFNTVYGRIFEKYQPLIFSYIYRRTSDTELAEDLTKDTFESMLKAITENTAWKESFSGWLYRIAHNLVIDHYRQRDRHKSISIDEIIEFRDDSQDFAESLMAKLENEEQLKKVTKAMSLLTDEQKLVIQLRFIEEYSFEEIAEVMDKNIGAVKALQHRALETLKQLVGKKSRPPLSIEEGVAPPNKEHNERGTYNERVSHILDIVVDNFPLQDAVGYHALSLESLKLLISTGQLFTATQYRRELKHLPVSKIVFQQKLNEFSGEQIELMSRQADIEQQQHALVSLLGLEMTQKNVSSCEGVIGKAFYNERHNRIMMNPLMHIYSLRHIRGQISLSETELWGVIQQARRRSGVLLSFSMDTLVQYGLEPQTHKKGLIISSTKGFSYKFFTGLYTTDNESKAYLQSLVLEQSLALR